MTHPLNPKHIGQQGIDLIKSFEGLRLEAYLCPANVWTIGYGSTAGVKPGMKLKDAAEAEELLRRDVQLYEKAVAKALLVQVRQTQFDAMVSFCYNIGIGNFKRSSVLQKINGGDDYGAAESFKLWIKGGGKVLPGLVRRRNAERELFLR